MDRFHHKLRGFVAAGIDIDDHKSHLVYEMMKAKGCDAADPWICFTDAFSDTDTVNDFVEELVAKEYRGSIAPRYDGWHTVPTIFVYRDGKFGKHSFDVEQTPDGDIARKATVVHVPSSSIIHLNDDAPHLLVFNLVSDHTLDQANVSIETALTRQFGRLSHILFFMSEEQMKTSVIPLMETLMGLDHYHRMFDVTWKEIKECAREYQVAAAAAAAPSRPHRALARPFPSPRTRSVATQTPSLDECYNCYESGAEHVLLPCAHMYFCEWCAEALKGNNSPCPICGKPVKDIFENYNVHRF